MSPEKHEIRRLEKQREMVPELAVLIDRKIAAIKADLMNWSDFPALVANIQSREAATMALENFSNEIT